MANAPEHRFRFDGTPRSARPGATLLDALTDGELPRWQRSIRYHRPRGPVCGEGYCTGCLVRVNGRPNVRACRYVPSDSDVVSTENSWPSPRFDLLGAFDVLYPRGVDTLHGFRRPAFLTRFYQRVIRRLAGYGAPPDPLPGPPRVGPVFRTSVDVVVVGAGTSGRAAAARLVAAGIRPLVLDRALAAAPIPGADVRVRTTVTFLPPASSDGFTLLGYEEPDRGVEVRARRVLVATGGYDASLLFEGNDRPGVVTADGALAMAERSGRPPFQRAVLVGGEARAEAVLERLADRIEAVVAPGTIPPPLVRRASDAEIPLYPRTLLVRANGRARVRSVDLRARGSGGRFSLACDAVVLAHRRLPTPQLFFQVGARMEWRAGTGAYYPVLTDSGATTVPGVYAVGAAAGVLGPGSGTSGERAADALAGRAPGGAPPPRVRADGPAELEGYYRELLRERPGGKWIACPCEDVLLSEIEEASRRGYRGIEVIKRYTGVGTGLCQGRYCLPDALLVLAQLEERPPPEVGYITQRPPVVPTPLAAFAALDTPAPPSEAP
jgi:sarcosine oxidase, subunit alpha